MKTIKKTTLILLTGLILFIMTSCILETVWSDGTLSYSEFTEKKNAWKEPENYTFKYSYSIGDSLVGPEYVTTVTDGKGVCISNFRADNHSNVRFTSITELYNYFDRIMQARPEYDSNGEYVHYSGKFDTISGITYPKILGQSCGKHNMDGYGGEYFCIADITLENHSTFLQKKNTWTEPERPYSFEYSIYYRRHYRGKLKEIGPIRVPVRHDSNSSDFSIAHNESENTVYDDYTGILQNRRINSISEYFDLVETVWKSEEANQRSIQGYGIAPFFKTTESYKDSPVLYDFNCQTFQTEYIPGHEDDSLYNDIELYILNFKYED